MLDVWPNANFYRMNDSFENPGLFEHKSTLGARVCKIFIALNEITLGLVHFIA